MDLQAAIGQFFDDKGQINLDPRLTLAGLCETLYQAEAAAGPSTARACASGTSPSRVREPPSTSLVLRSTPALSL